MKFVLPLTMVFMGSFLWSEELVWYVNDFPPYTVLSGEKSGEGIIQKLIPLLMKEIPDLKITPLVANISRIAESMKTGVNGIYGTMRKTPEREVYTLYSEPYLIYQSAGILLHSSARNFWAPFVEASGFNLEKALGSPNFRLALIKDVSVGAWIDEPAKKARSENLLWLNLSAENPDDPRMALLSMNRVTALSGYEESLRLDIRKAQLPLQDFTFRPIAGAPFYQKMSLAVPKTDWGKKILAKLNPVLIRLRPQVAKEYELWISAESVEQYRKQTF